MSKRAKRQIERRYVVEYVTEEFPNATGIKYNAQLGQPPPEFRARFPEVPLSHFRRWRRYADAVLLNEGKLYLIEAKIHVIRKGVGDLDYYSKLIPFTPELAKYRSLPLVKQLVAPIIDEATMMYAKERRVEVKVFMPDWVREYLVEKGVLV